MGAMALKSTASRVFAHSFVQAQVKENIKAPRHWPLRGEAARDRWIHLTQRASNAENGSIWWRHHGLFFELTLDNPFLNSSNDSWEPCHLRLPAMRLFVQQFVLANKDTVTPGRLERTCECRVRKSATRPKLNVCICPSSTIVFERLTYRKRLIIVLIPYG